MNLPSDILLEIVTRLPAIDVIYCKLVCKNWLKILSTREFAKLHLSRSNHCLAAIQLERPKQFFRIFKFGDDNDPQNFYDDDPVIEFDLSIFPKTPYGLVGSVNGLVCFSAYDYFSPSGEILYVFNPVTREYVTLPSVTGLVNCSRHLVYGFGVGTISGQYKVVTIRHGIVYDNPTDRVYIGIKDFDCRVYTLGTNSWRTIGAKSSATAYYHSAHGNGLFFNGNLHWLITNIGGSNTKGELISCFDLDNESFRQFPSPFDRELPIMHKFSLGIVTGCLCLCENTIYDDIVIWVMKEYEVKKSWTKDFVISGYDCYDNWAITALKIFKDGDILLSNREYLLTYSNDSKTLQRINHICYEDIQLVLHVSSFLSLKDLEPEKVRTF